MGWSMLSKRNDESRLFSLAHRFVEKAGCQLLIITFRSDPEIPLMYV